MAALESKYLRVIDANYNRAKEALRVCEDICRFLMDDPVLTRRFKQCRHALTKAILEFPVPYRKLVRSRNLSEDVGRRGSIHDLKKRPGWRDVMAANLKRGQEASRVLEEFAKIIAPKQSYHFQKVRFRIYELEKSCFRKF